jgi:hypothetical protein
MQALQTMKAAVRMRAAKIMVTAAFTHLRKLESAMRCAWPRDQKKENRREALRARADITSLNGC